jgi:hypothetical protein
MRNTIKWGTSNGFYLQPKLGAAPALVDMYSHFGLSFSPVTLLILKTDPIRFDIHQFLDLSVGPWDEEGVLETVTSVESYFFLTLSFKDPIRAMVGMRIQNCNDAWFGDALCQHQAAFTLAIMYVMDLLLFFLDTFLWYVVWNAVYSILRSFALGLSLWTPWADIYTRLPKRIYAKLKGSVLSCADMFAVVRITEAHSDGLVNEEDGSP